VLGGGGGRVGSAWYDLELRDQGFLGQVQQVGSSAGKGLDPAVDAAEDLDRALDDAGNAADETSGRLGRFGSFGKGAIEGVGQAVGNMAANFAMALPGQAMEALGNAITLASDKAESGSKAAVLFGESVGMIEKASESAATTVGMSSGAYLAAAGDLGNLITNFGITGDEAANMSIDMLQLAADMGSFNNADPTEVVQAMGAAFRGETEPIRRFGVMLDDATIRQKAVEMGLAASTKEVDKNARALATNALIVEQTSAAHGDFAKTSDGLANAQRIAAARTEEAWTTVGEALAPIAATIVPMVADAMVGLVGVVGQVTDLVLNNGPAVVAGIGAIGLVVAATVVPPFLAWAAATLVAIAPLIAIAAAAAGFVAVLEHFGLLDDVVGMLGSLASMVGDTLAGAFGFAMGIVEDLGVRLGGLIGVIENTLGAIIDFADAAGKALSGDFEGAAAAAERGMQRVEAVAVSMGQVIEGSSHASIVAQKEQAAAAEEAAAAIERASEAIGTDLMEVSQAHEGAATAATSAKDRQIAALTESAQATEDFSSASSVMADRLEETALRAAAAFAGVKEAIAGHIRGAADLGFEEGAAITENIGRGLAQGSLELGSAMDDLKWILENGLTPDQQAQQALGAEWIKDFRKGIESEIPGAKEASQRVGVEALQALSQSSIGNKEAKRIGEIVDELYASGLDEKAIVGALAAEGVGYDALIALGKVKGWDVAGIRDAVEWAGGLGSQTNLARTKAWALGQAAKDGIISLPWGSYGVQAGVLFGTGISSPRSLSTIRRNAGIAAKAAAGALRQQSPAEYGPLSEGGGSLGWGEKFADLFATGITRGVPRVAGAARQVGGALRDLEGGVNVDLRARADFDSWGRDAVAPTARGQRGDRHLHVHAGVIVADDGGIRQLQRRLDQVARHWDRG
jgi:hypothetical protein